MRDRPVGPVLLGFSVQAVILFVPFMPLELAAESVGARRAPFRAAYLIALILAVQIQGLGGLSTIAETDQIDRFGRLAGHLGLCAIFEVIAVVVAAEAARMLDEASCREADEFNAMVAHHSAVSARACVG